MPVWGPGEGRAAGDASGTDATRRVGTKDQRKYTRKFRKSTMREDFRHMRCKAFFGARLAGWSTFAVNA